MDLNITSLGGEYVLYVDSTLVIIVVALYCLTSIAGCLASLVIAVTIIKSKTLRTAMNVTLVNLAIADIFVSLVNNPMRILLASGVISVDLCFIDVFVQTLCDCVKPLMLAATSFERYQSIAKPLENRGKFRRTIITVILSWIFAFCVGVVSVLVTVDGATLYPCSLAEHLHAGSVTNFRELLITLPVGLICLLLVILFYYLMIKTLNEHSKNMAKKPKAFKNKIKPANTKHPNQSLKLSKGKIEVVATDNVEEGTNDQAWKNEQYTEIEKCEIQSPHSKGCNTKETEAGTSTENTCVVSDAKPEVDDNIHNISDVVSLVSTASKRFTVRETRKNLMNTLRKHRLIGNKKRFTPSLSAPECATQTLDEHATSKAKHRYSHELQATTTNGNSALHSSEEALVPSVFTSLALNLRELRLFAKSKPQNIQISTTESDIGNNSTKQVTNNIGMKDNLVTDNKGPISVKTKIKSVTSTKGLVDLKNNLVADVKSSSLETTGNGVLASTTVLAIDNYDKKDARNSSPADVEKITPNDCKSYGGADFNQIVESTVSDNCIDTGGQTLNKVKTSLESSHTVKCKYTCEPNILTSNRNGMISLTGLAVDESVTTEHAINLRDTNQLSETHKTNGDDSNDVVNDSGRDDIAKIDAPNGLDTDSMMSLHSKGISEHNKALENIDKEDENTSTFISANQDSENATVALVKRPHKTNKIYVVDTDGMVSLNSKEHSKTTVSINREDKTAPVAVGADQENEHATVTLVKRPKKAAHKIDVVEMDGTVHKRVEVQGSVTGAVCVFNSSNKVQGRRKVEMRAAKRIAALIGSFVILWLPLPLSVIFVVFQGQVTQRSVEMLMVMGAISAMTSAVNPLLNLFLNKQIQSAARSNVRRGVSILRKRYT